MYNNSLLFYKYSWACLYSFESKVTHFIFSKSFYDKFLTNFFLKKEAVKD